MKFRTPVAIVAAIALVLTLSNVALDRSQSRGYSESFPNVICPPAVSDGRNQISVPTSKTNYRVITKGKVGLHATKSLQLGIGSDATLFDAMGVSPLTTQSGGSGWAGAAICTSPQSDAWFVGGSADISSRSKLFIVNSGLSSGSIDIEIWTEAGPQLPLSEVISSNSVRSFAIDALAPGAKKLVVHVATKAGRINAFMVDVRGRGLSTLGGDIVNPMSAPGTDVMIVGIPHQVEKSKSSAHTLRILSPGSADANIRVDVISKDGNFAPAGIDGELIHRGQVSEFQLNPTLAAGAFALRIRSDQPIVAAVDTSVKVRGSGDFVWTTAAPRLAPLAIAITGAPLTLIFTGSEIAVVLSIRLANGKVTGTTVTGSDIASWRVPSDAVTLRVTSVRGVTHGALLVTTTKGMATAPLLAGSQIERAILPGSNIQVINP